MPEPNAIEVTIGANTSQYVAGMKDASGATGTAAKEMQLGISDIGKSAKEAHEPLSGFAGVIKTYRTEVRQEGRYARFLAGDIASMGIASKGAAGEVTLLISAFAFGGGIGLAIESVKLLVKLFNEGGGEIKKFTEDAISSVKDLQKRVDEYIASLHKETEAQRLARQEIGPLEEKENALKSDLIAKTDAQAEMQAKYDAAVKSGSGGAIAALRMMVVARTEEVDKAQKLVDLTEMELSAKRALVAGAGAAGAAAAASEEHTAYLQGQAAEDVEAAARSQHILKQSYDEKTKIAHDGLVDILKEQEDFQDRETRNALDDAAHFQHERQKQAEVADAETAKALEKYYADETKAAEKALHDQERTARAVASSIEHAFGTALKSVVRGTQSVGDALEGMFVSIAESGIDALVKLGAEQIAMAILGHSVAQAKAISQVTENAAVAGAAAAASTAAIPFIGPEMAIEAGLAMQTAVQAAFTPLASALGGYDIPGSVDSQLVLAHGGEMVLPSHIADPLREALDGGGMGGEVHVHIHAMDGASVHRVVHSDDFVRAMRNAKRTGRMP